METDIINYYNKHFDIIINIISTITNFMKKYKKDYENKFNTQLYIEGSYCSFTNNNDEYNNKMIKKIANLLWCMNLLNDNPIICEIGFNTGYSSSIIMHGLYNKNPNFYIFDYCLHSYLKPCFNLFKNNFEKSANKIELIEGDSIITLPRFINENKNLLEKFDFIHVDGGHTKECIDNDLKNCDMLIKKGGIIIIDDTNIIDINNAIDYYLNNKNYTELFLLNVSDFDWPHRIIKKND